MSTKNHFILGTRGSLLAWTQASQVARELERFSNITIELKEIKTQGDLETQKPLWQLDGKDFFTKELDHALLSNEVDFVVHSYKDLGSIRPKGIELGSITKRLIPNDILFLKKETVIKLQNKEKVSFKVGTSSPRRITNLESSLSDFLPHSPLVEAIHLRGNVNTRISKLESDDYDGVVLAFAGVERLCRDQNAKKEIKQLLDHCSFLILPLKEFPPASCQGALAIEYGSSSLYSKQIKQILSNVHCQKTQRETAIERNSFKEYGGGCHLAVGIHCHEFKSSTIFYEKGSHEKKEIHRSLILKRQLPKLKNDHHIFIGLPFSAKTATTNSSLYDELIIKKPDSTKINLPKNANILIASSYSIDSIENSSDLNSLWVSGARTWKKLCQKGFFVNGSTEGLSEDFIHKYQETELVNLMLTDSKNNFVLTHKESISSWGTIIGVYDRLLINYNDHYKSQVENTDIFYWTSFNQYKEFNNHFNLKKEALHCCGLGKTYDQMITHETNVVPFASMDEFKSWACQK